MVLSSPLPAPGPMDTLHRDNAGVAGARRPEFNTLFFVWEGELRLRYVLLLGGGAIMRIHKWE